MPKKRVKKKLTKRQKDIAIARELAKPGKLEKALKALQAEDKARKKKKPPKRKKH
ncbi:MAG: hypothetical protein ACE5HX_05905 [bacterium]